jgi:methionine sulfoxide reductase heme-binding subunit
LLRFTPDWIFGKISDPLKSGLRMNLARFTHKSLEIFGRSRLWGLVARILARKILALGVLFGVGVFLLIVPALTNQLGANPIERLLHVSGEIAIWSLGAVLSLTPLRVLFPRSAIVNALNRHRRYIGVSACIYGLIHFSCHVLYQGDWDDLLQSFTKPFTWFGLAGLSILVLLASTSNNWAVRKLGGRRWKLLHRLAYLAAIVLIYHQTIAGKGHWYVARWLLLLLVALEGARLTKKFWPGKPSNARFGN